MCGFAASPPDATAAKKFRGNPRRESGKHAWQSGETDIARHTNEPSRMRTRSDPIYRRDLFGVLSWSPGDREFHIEVSPFHRATEREANPRFARNSFFFRGGINGRPLVLREADVNLNSLR